jgi:hypothetical protein
MIATLAPNSIANSATIKASEGNITSKTSTTLTPIKTVKLSIPSLIVPTIAQIKQHIADVSQKYGLDYDQLSSVIQCESAFNSVKYGDKGKAFGVAQFHKATFDEYCSGNYYNSIDQLNCMAKMFSTGGAGNWSCFNKLYTQVIFHTAADQLTMAKN